MTINDFKKLPVWQETIRITKIIYDISGKKEFSRDFGLRDQIRRAIVSVSNSQFEIRNEIIMNFRRFIPNLFLILIISYFLYLINPALLGQLGGTFKQREVPTEYIALKDKFVHDQDFYRTLWVPRQQRFTFSSYIHPSIEAEPLLSATNSASLAKALQSPHAEDNLSDLGVKYIILPYDPYGEVFVEDRKYSQKKRDGFEKVLDKVKWLKRVDCSIVTLLHCSDSPFGNITVYETRKHKDLFYIIENSLIANDGLRIKSIMRNTQLNNQVKYKVISPTKYDITVKNVKKGDVLVFAENYNKYWEAMIITNCGLRMTNCGVSNKQLAISNYSNLNEFVLPEGGSYTLHVYYSAEKYYIIGRVISGAALITIVGLLFKSRNSE